MSDSDPAFSQPARGIFLVPYRAPEDLAPQHQGALIEAIVEASGGGRLPTGVVFTLTASIRGVDVGVPTFWLGVTARKDTGLRAMAIVTRSAAVRVAATGFGLANRARGLALEVQTFPADDAALAWVGALVAGTRSP